MKEWIILIVLVVAFILGIIVCFKDIDDDSDTHYS